MCNDIHEYYPILPCSCSFASLHLMGGQKDFCSAVLKSMAANFGCTVMCEKFLGAKECIVSSFKCVNCQKLPFKRKI